MENLDTYFTPYSASLANSIAALRENTDSFVKQQILSRTISSIVFPLFSTLDTAIFSAKFIYIKITSIFDS